MKALLILLGVMISSLNGEEVVRLINTRTNTPIVTFVGDKVEIHHPLLAKELEHSGIYIPPLYKEEFEGKNAIFPGDPLFQKAFIQVYCPLVIADPAYIWEKE